MHTLDKLYSIICNSKFSFIRGCKFIVGTMFQICSF